MARRPRSGSTHRKTRKDQRHGQTGVASAHSRLTRHGHRARCVPVNKATPDGRVDGRRDDQEAGLRESAARGPCPVRARREERLRIVTVIHKQTIKIPAGHTVSR
jgi:hypothetical protein